MRHEVGNNYRVLTSWTLEVGSGMLDGLCARQTGVGPAFQGLGLRTLDMYISPHLPCLSVVFPWCACCALPAACCCVGRLGVWIAAKRHTSHWCVILISDGLWFGF